MRLVQKIAGITLTAMSVISLSGTAALAGAARHANVLPGVCETPNAQGGASTVLLSNGRVRLRSNSPQSPFVQTAGVVVRTTNQGGVPVAAPLANGVLTFTSNNNTPNVQFVFAAVGHFQNGTFIFFDENTNVDGNFSIDTRQVDNSSLGQLVAVSILYSAANNGRITLSNFALDGRPVPVSVASPQDCTFLSQPTLPIGVVGGAAAKAAGTSRRW